MDEEILVKSQSYTTESLGGLVGVSENRGNGQYTPSEPGTFALKFLLQKLVDRKFLVLHN